MKKLVVSVLISLVTYAAIGNPITGTVTIDKSIEKEVKGGTLFVFAKKAGGKAGDGQMPLAVQRITDPKFPVKFQLSSENAMVQGTPFEGPFTVYARYSLTGSASDKSGPEGATPADQKIKPGDSNLKIELKKKK